MNLIGWTAVLALALQGAVPVAAPLEPTGKWQVAFDDDLCAMAHEFGSGPKAVTLAFRPFPMNNQMQAVVLLSTRGGEPIRGDATITLLPQQRTFPARYRTAATKSGARAVQVELDRDLIPALRAATTLTINAGSYRQTFTLPQTQGALRVLDTCETSLLREWGVDPALDRTLTPRLIGDPARYFGEDSYPAKALRANVEGRAVALLAVASTGKVSACRIVRSSGDALLDTATCERAPRVRYTAPRNSAGERIASWALLPVRWEL